MIVIGHGAERVRGTLNPRLHPDQVVYIADHAEDTALFFDLTFLPLVEAIAHRVKTIKTFVDEEDGIRVTDINGNSLAIQFPRIPISGGVVNAPNIVNYPSDSALQAWVKAALKAVGHWSRTPSINSTAMSRSRAATSNFRWRRSPSARAARRSCLRTGS